MAIAPPLRLLHLHSSFSLGGKEARAVHLMNAMGRRAQHVILSAVPDALDARSAIAPDVDAAFPADGDVPPLYGRPGLARYRSLARWFQDFDLLLTYNWGAMDAVMAHRVMAPLMALPPLVHHEDGFNQDESDRRLVKRNLFRRLALPTAAALVVPSATLAAVARHEWGAAKRVEQVANGIDTARYAAMPDRAIPGLVRVPGDVVIGTVAGLRAVKNLPALVQAVQALPDHVRLVIVGEGPERAAIAAAGKAAGLGDRLLLPGFMEQPWRWIGHFDMLALSSLSEQAPIAVIEAMAAGLPVVSPDVGDVAAMVAPDNRPFIVPSPAGLADALAALVNAPARRTAIGSANRQRAQTQFDAAQMLARYNAIYTRALRRRARDLPPGGLFTGTASGTSH